MLRTSFIYLAVILLTFAARAESEAPAEVNTATESKKVEETTQSLTKEQILQIKDSDVVVGNADAPITIVEYASMSCSHCATFFKTTFLPLKEKYIDTGKVKFVFRDFPLDEFSVRASMVAKCSADEGVENFIKFKKVLFSTQRNWAGKKNYLEILSNIAKLGGMKQSSFDACVSDKALEELIFKNRLDASKVLEVRSTPTFFLNGEIHAGAKTFEFVSETIDTILGDSNIDLEITQ